MTKKEVFLQNILANKKIWEDAYEFNSRLPDSFFESLPIGLPEKKPMQSKPGMEKAHAALDAKPASNILNTPVIKSNNQYVGNKRTVQKIIKEHGQELMKLQIIELYEKITGEAFVKPETKDILNRVESAINNTLSQL